MRLSDIVKDTEEEVVFRMPIWVNLGMLAVCVMWGSVINLAFSSFSALDNNRPVTYGLLCLLPVFLFLAFLYLSLPHELTLDLRRRTFQEGIGITPLVCRINGDFDDIEGVLVTLRREPFYTRCQVHLKWRKESVRSRLPSSYLGFVWAATGDASEAEAYGIQLAEHLHVPFLGLKRI